MKINNYNIKKKALEPLIATILLIVVSVILVTIVLTWGKEFSTSSLNKTNNFAELKVSDATHFIYPKSAQEGIIQFTYSPPAEIKQDINVTHYRVINIPEMTEPIALSEPKILSPSLNILELPCLYEYSTTTPDLYIQLITADNTYIDIKTKDAGMVCSSGGTGTEEDPIVICNAEDLNNVRNDLDANYSLGKDIDLQCFSRQDVNGWEPIGNFSTRFTGSFNGNNKKISNLYINRPATDYVGFFGITDTGIDVWLNQPTEFRIQNLLLEDVNISGKSYVGGLIGKNGHDPYYDPDTWCDSLNLFNCSVTGKVLGNKYVGGLIGYNIIWDEAAPISVSKNKIYNSSFNGFVLNDRYESTGGLIGVNGANLQNCFSSGVVIGKRNTGGLVGQNSGGHTQTAGIIEKSYSNAVVSGTTNVGGLVGDGYTDYYMSFGLIRNSYSFGSVSGTTYVGGLVGANKGTSKIYLSYSVGLVSGTTNVGGLVGANAQDDWGYEEVGITDTSYYNNETSGRSDDDGRGTPKTTEEMKQQATFTDWDFSTVWAISPTINDGYPYLQNNPPR